MPARLSIGMLVFPRLTVLDLVGPYEVLARMPETEIHLVAPAAGPVASEHGLALVAPTAWHAAPQFDVLVVPGGDGVNALLADESCLNFLRSQAERARLVTSVCTGALVLGAAGLLRGYRATTHWLSLELLSLVGAQPVAERVVVDRNRITGGGITAGIDFALTITARLHGDAVARQIQLMLQYDPQPPFECGSPESAGQEMVARVTAARVQVQAERRRLIEQAVSRW